MLKFQWFGSVNKNCCIAGVASNRYSFYKPRHFVLEECNTAGCGCLTNLLVFWTQLTRATGAPLLLQFYLHVIAGSWLDYGFDETRSRGRQGYDMHITADHILALWSYSMVRPISLLASFSPTFWPAEIQSCSTLREFTADVVCVNSDIAGHCDYIVVLFINVFIAASLLGTKCGLSFEYLVYGRNWTFSIVLLRNIINNLGGLLNR